MIHFSCNSERCKHNTPVIFLKVLQGITIRYHKKKIVNTLLDCLIGTTSFRFDEFIASSS